MNPFSIMSKGFAFLILLLNVVNGHIVIRTPIPFGNPDTSPLQASGSDYPMKGQSANATYVQTVAVGSSFEASFSGTAVHNGGSCQFALTKDMQPSKTSDFRVILSIHGGCPGVDGSTTTYQVTVPSEIPANEGNSYYAGAWVWFNNVGNREAYLNTFPLHVIGGSATQADFESLPPMALYNLQEFSNCETVETFDVLFPNPGKYVITAPGFKPKPPANCGSKTGTDLDAGASGGMGASNSSGSSPVSASSSAPVNSAANGAPSVYTSTSSTMIVSTVYASSPGSSTPSASILSTAEAPSVVPVDSTVTETTLRPTDSAAPYANFSAVAGTTRATLITSMSTASTASMALSNVAPPAATNDGSGTGATQPCSTNGALVCSNDGARFGLCNFGLAIMESVAAGTVCSNGAIVKRSAKFARL